MTSKRSKQCIDLCVLGPIFLQYITYEYIISENPSFLHSLLIFLHAWEKAGKPLFMFVYETMSMETNVEGNVVHCLNLGHFGGGCNAD